MVIEEGAGGETGGSHGRTRRRVEQTRGGRRGGQYFYNN